MDKVLLDQVAWMFIGQSGLVREKIRP